MPGEAERRVWTVRDITSALQGRLGGIPSVWVEAEFHSARASGGQVYFTLVDGHQVAASMAEGLFSVLAVTPHEGARVQAYGRVEFWAPRSRLSFRVERLELAGEGALLARIAALRAVLEREGLLAAGRKRELPLLPRRVGVVTSAGGAAVADLLTTMRARFPGVDVVVADVPVQGAVAAGAVCRAIVRLNTMAGVDVIVVTRGGGALEDLMAFNSEMVCRTVAASRVPVVSAVGHQRDVTLCDLVADVRVATPTAAGAAVVPDAAALRRRLEGSAARLASALRWVSGEADAACAVGRTALVRTLEARLRAATGRVERAADRAVRGIEARVAQTGQDMRFTGERLGRGVDAHVARATHDLAARQAVLTALSPYGVLARGYAIVKDADGRAVAGVAGLAAGDSVVVTMTDGSAQASIQEVTRT